MIDGGLSRDRRDNEPENWEAQRFGETDLGTREKEWFGAVVCSGDPRML